MARDPQSRLIEAVGSEAGDFESEVLNPALPLLCFLLIDLTDRGGYSRFVAFVCSGELQSNRSIISPRLFRPHPEILGCSIASQDICTSHHCYFQLHPSLCLELIPLAASSGWQLQSLLSMGRLLESNSLPGPSQPRSSRSQSSSSKTLSRGQRRRSYR